MYYIGKISGIRNEYNGIDVEINIYGKDGHIVDCVLIRY